MVVGLDKFRQYFSDHTDDYVLIGGAACDLLFSSAGLQYRATKDLDVVLCVEVVSADFARAFVTFLEDGGYRTWASYDGERKFFRFEKPEDSSFPHMIELFARPPASMELPASDRYVRLTVEDAIVSLSALLLDEHYFAALKSGARQLDGLSVLDETLIIPFKARAFLDLSSRKASGAKVNDDDIKKHKNDVFRLVQLLPGDTTVSLAEPIKNDLRQFVSAMANDAVDPRKFNVPIPKDVALAAIVRTYALDASPAAKVLQGPKLTSSDSRLLALLRQRGGIIQGTQVALAKELGVHRSTLGKSISRLVDRGLVHKGRRLLTLKA